MITINYLPYHRLHFSKLLFYFMEKIKPENKEKIEMFIYTDNPNYFMNINIGITINIVHCSSWYVHKVMLYKNFNNKKYSMKLDEDIFMNNYLWDYMIENISILDDEENLIFAPTISCGIPTCDYFINDFFSEEEKDKITETFLRCGFGYDNVMRNPWGYDVEFLNDYTIRAKEWNSENWLEAINDITHHFKGYHPVRNGYETHITLNNCILNNTEKFENQKDFEIFKLKNRYFTNTAFFIKTDTWMKILDDKSLWKDDFDEVPLNEYMFRNKKSYCFVKNGFAIHTSYNTNYKREDELNFYSKLENKIIK